MIKVDPQSIILEGWRLEEINRGEIMTREEMANNAGMVMCLYYVQLFSVPGVLEKTKAKLDEKFKTEDGRHD